MNQEVGEVGCVGKIGGFCMERLCMAFKIKMRRMEKGWRSIEWFLKEAKVFGGIRP